ncbi:NADPH2:quinone reductase [Parafrankia irregularis]|uniref:NADPH2:quinone reductase n=1 Tax=Parafrankia irregularis TaxID=795642 RepID=A0A0S4QM44_9ACTN|nr:MULTISPECIES: NADPH:quinone oxidoreductase family protein [Parafrankia]MBE3200259.1 NADPH:quinone oxidoreductase family protein [Parafrankia sp. CH37]CUU56541.1 NADPH2:quinone reductase [Parafrankia irregularis]
MRALLIPRLDGPEAAVLAEVPEPEGTHPWAGGERLLVEVRAAGVSFPDLLQSRGGYQHGRPAPYVSGGEFSGVVLEAPAGSRLRPGDRVAGLSVFGALAERVLAVPRYTVRLPETLSWEQGAALFLNYATAWFTLLRAAFRDGESVLVHGAAGGVGTATLDLLRGRAAPSIALVSTEVKAAVAIEAGADHAVQVRDGWSTEVRTLTGGRGVDVVVDPVGGDRVVESLRALDVGGRLMVVGFAAGRIPEVRLNRLLLRDLTVMGVAVEPWVERHPRLAGQLIHELETAAAAGRLHPVIGHRLEWARASEALCLLDGRASTGKVVVTVSD